MNMIYISKKVNTTCSVLIFASTLIGEWSIYIILYEVISPGLKPGFINAGIILGTSESFSKAIGIITFIVFTNFGADVEGVPFFLYFFVYYAQLYFFCLQFTF